MAKPFFLIQTCIKITLTANKTEKSKKATRRLMYLPATKPILRLQFCTVDAVVDKLYYLCTYFLAFTANWGAPFTQFTSSAGLLNGPFLPRRGGFPFPLQRRQSAEWLTTDLPLLWPDNPNKLACNHHYQPRVDRVEKAPVPPPLPVSNGTPPSGTKGVLLIVLCISKQGGSLGLWRRSRGSRCVLCQEVKEAVATAR